VIQHRQTDGVEPVGRYLIAGKQPPPFPEEQAAPLEWVAD
jgi:hypothetical protein